MTARKRWKPAPSVYDLPKVAPIMVKVTKSEQLIANMQHELLVLRGKIEAESYSLEDTKAGYIEATIKVDRELIRRERRNLISLASTIAAMTKRANILEQSIILEINKGGGAR